MASLAAKYDYLEKLTRKVCVSHNQEPKKRPFGKVKLHINLLVNIKQTPVAVMQVLIAGLFIHSKLLFSKSDIEETK